MNPSVQVFRQAISIDERRRMFRLHPWSEPQSLGLLRFMQEAKVVVLEVTAPDKQDRRRRGKNDDLDAQNAAHAALAGQRTVTPRSRDGMIEIPTHSDGLPEDGGQRQAHRPADDP